MTPFTLKQIDLRKTLPDDRERFLTLRAISAMKDANSGKIFVDFLQAVAKTLDVDNRTAVPPQLQWGQGAAQLLDDLITLVQEAGPLAEQIRLAAEAG